MFKDTYNGFYTGTPIGKVTLATGRESGALSVLQTKVGFLCIRGVCAEIPPSKNTGLSVCLSVGLLVLLREGCAWV